MAERMTRDKNIEAASFFMVISMSLVYLQLEFAGSGKFDVLNINLITPNVNTMGDWVMSQFQLAGHPSHLERGEACLVPIERCLAVPPEAE